jgi:hypothetical protein
MTDYMRLCYVCLQKTLGVEAPDDSGVSVPDVRSFYVEKESKFVSQVK